MSTKHANGLNDSGEALAQTLGDSIESATLGTDTEGYDHHYYRPADAVVVYDGRDVDHVEYLDGALLAEWTQFVTAKRGWTSRGQLARALIDADTRRKGGR